jgi:beta-N-acetylhexosaminidase
VRLIESGCDMVMVCAHFTGTVRARGFAKAIIAAAEDGRLDPGLLARSRARIENLLARAPTNEVELLPEDVFRAHANVAALYDAATVEVV